MNGGFLAKFLGGSSVVNNGDTPEQTNDSTNTNKDNNKTNIDKQENIWDTASQDSNNAQQNQQQQQFSQQQTQQVDPQEALQKHIASLKLTDGVDFAQIQQDLQTGNTETLNKAFETTAANAYKSALTQMNKIMDAKIAEAKQEALNESKATMDADMAVREMNSRLPFTVDPNIAPVAKAVLNQFLKGGKDLPTSIKATADFFKSTAAKINQNNMPPSNQNGSNFSQQQNFDNNNSNDNRSEHDEWLDLLSA
ncbi:MAG: hypothetical protein BV456_05920 [Thermoplasmata archaeon M8B2D]|nr:MAG: hypothetical protein BV456_05920 [Thermoplasmata archaeon M8B2D]